VARQCYTMGIPEYWIADYAGLGGREFIADPKQPTFFVCELIDGEYVKRLFRGNDVIIYRNFIVAGAWKRKAEIMAGSAKKKHKNEKTYLSRCDYTR
jgi:Putative restriction endonuclease